MSDFFDNKIKLSDEELLNECKNGLSQETLIDIEQELKWQADHLIAEFDIDSPYFEELYESTADGLLEAEDLIKNLSGAIETENYTEIIDLYNKPEYAKNLAGVSISFVPEEFDYEITFPDNLSIMLGDRDSHSYLFKHFVNEHTKYIYARSI